jgi:hypothetical protein
MDGYPDHYEILPPFVEKGIDVVRVIATAIQRAVVSEIVGRSVPNHMSNHYHAEHFKPVSDPYSDSKNEVQAL